MVNVVGQEGLGDILGQQIGGGISSGLQMLLQAKMNSMQEQEKMKNINSFFPNQKNINPNTNPSNEMNENQPQMQDENIPKKSGKFELTPEQEAQFANAYPQAYKSYEAGKKSEEKKIIESQKLAHQETEKIKERNLKFFDESSDAIRALDENAVGLEQLSKLSEKIGAKEGDETFFNRLGKSFRYDPKTKDFTRVGKATSTPEEDRYMKLIADQTKNIKFDFPGGKITNFDIEVFLRRFPDLLQTKQGRKEIFETLKDYNDYKLIYNKVRKKEIADRKGKIDPYELDEIIEQKAGKQLAPIRERLVNRGFNDNEANEIKEGSIITNKKTGERKVLKGGKWQTI